MSIIEASHDVYGDSDLRASLEGEDDELIIQMENIHKTYLLGIEGVPALRGVSLSVRRGEFVVIFGLSGGGKTTLLNIIGTIDKPTKGEMKLCGTRIDSNTPDKVLSNLRLNHIGFVFQTFNLLSSLTALENVEMPMILAGNLSASERRARAIALLERVGMANRLDHLPSQLSGGEQQRVTIARAIANRPQLLLLDEPTGDLDTKNSAIVMKLLTELNRKEKITLVMVTHDVSLKNFADRVIWMRDGKIMRLEIIPKEVREMRLKQLDNDLEKLTKGQMKRAKWTHTVLRRPDDYETHPQYQKREPIYYNFKKEFQNIENIEQITQKDYEEKIFQHRRNLKHTNKTTNNNNNNSSSDHSNEDVIYNDDNVVIDIQKHQSKKSQNTKIRNVNSHSSQQSSKLSDNANPSNVVEFELQELTKKLDV